MSQDLGEIHSFIASDAPLPATAEVFQAGQRVRIRRGPLRGSEGTILECRGAGQLLIAMDGLQPGVYLQIDESLVELV
jgi:transcription antitermination factor NusG